MLKSKRNILIIALIFLAIVVGGYFYYTNSTKKVQVKTESVQVSQARRGDLTVFASASGKIVPELEYGLGFQKKGTLIELNVKVGEKVTKGKLLARLQTEVTQDSIEADIAAAELGVAVAQQALDTFVESAESVKATTMQSIATNALAVKDAQYQLELYLVPTTQIKLSPMEAFDMTKQKLAEASAAFEPYKYISQYFDKRKEMLDILYLAQADYNTAVKRLEYEYQVEIMQANLNKARLDYEKYKDGPDPTGLAIKKAELASAQAKLVLAKKNQSILDMTAPIDGNIVAVSAKVGEILDVMQVMQLVSYTCPQLEIYLDENDLSKVKVDYATEMEFDALPNKKYYGKITHVDPSLVDVSGVFTVRAMVSMDEASCLQADDLVIGLNAAVDVIAGKVKDSVLIPIEALREIDANEYGVFVMENGSYRFRQVEVGLMDITTAEILSGVEDGEVITTGTIKTN